VALHRAAGPVSAPAVVDGDPEDGRGNGESYLTEELVVRHGNPLIATYVNFD
jgi:hypothetical protein